MPEDQTGEIAGTLRLTGPAPEPLLTASPVMSVFTDHALADRQAEGMPEPQDGFVMFFLMVPGSRATHRTWNARYNWP